MVWKKNYQNGNMHTIKHKLNFNPLIAVFVISIILSIISMVYSFRNDYIITYGDSESHLNISKRVIHSLTPGVAQLGGIWLPLPHLLMVPFVAIDFLWRSGLAGSIISGISFVVSCLYLYRLTHLVTENKAASFVAFLVFALNPNILYMQSTPMTEILLISFFTVSSFYFIKFLKNDSDVLSLITASFFAFCATLTRYDGWFLVMVEASVIFLYYLNKRKWSELEGKFILFSTLAFFGILMWLVWNLTILGDPLYFTNSSFSAKSQQNQWYARGELPAYNNIYASFLYYSVTMIRNLGWFVFGLAAAGLVLFLFKREIRNKALVFLLLAVPFIFNMITLYMGQSVIFIPDLTPKHFEWNLFNVRYGMMMVPSMAFFVGFLFTIRNKVFRTLVIIVIAIQLGLFVTGREQVITLADGTVGLSASRHPDAERWITKNYDEGLVLLDDYARTISILRSNIPMQNVIYIGNKPYWEESLRNPQKHARWVIIQQDDTVWKSLYDDPAMQKHLFKYYTKVYTSPKILIFKINPLTLTGGNR